MSIAKRFPAVNLSQSLPLAAKSIYNMENDTLTWEFIYNEYCTQIIRFCGNYTKNKHDAEDLAQDVFIKSEKGFASYNSEKPLKPWIYQIARNTCLNHLRDQAKHHQIEKYQWSKSFYASTTRIHVVDSRPSPASEVINSEFEAKLQEKMDQLPAEQRDAIILKYNEGLTRKEIAEAMGLSLALVKLRLYEGLKSLRQNFEK
ncbi:MAG: sigma-70 family RNA polymerase sigma factor [Planctomycetes bacterium]|nr:sigma-70 family RNA polymerase sigma factor [Planctomycetota bacterium]